MYKISYSGGTPGADSSDYTLYDSTGESKNHLNAQQAARYRLTLKHSHAGTLKIYAQAARSGTWVQFYEKAMPAPTTSTRFRTVSVPIATHDDIKAVWTNGGSAQTTWYVGQALMTSIEDDNARLERIETVPGPVASLTNFSTASSTTHAVYTIPSAWLGRRVRIRSKGANMWVVFGTSSGVEADRTAAVTGTPPAWTGSVKISDWIPDAGFADYYVDPSWTHFSFESDAAGTIYVIPSDYDQTDFPD